MATVAMDSLEIDPFLICSLKIHIKFQSEANQLCHITQDKSPSCHTVDSGVAAFVEGVREVVAKEGRERQGGKGLPLI